MNAHIVNFDEQLGGSMAKVKRLGNLVGNKGAIPLDGPVSGGCHRAETGYISKVQATEFGHIINSSKERGLSSYILYSLFTYAGSRGLVLFDGNSYKNHYASSLHIKVM